MKSACQPTVCIRARISGAGSMILSCKPFLKELPHPSQLLQQSLLLFSVSQVYWVSSCPRLSVSSCAHCQALWIWGRAGMGREELAAAPFGTMLQGTKPANSPSSWPSCKFGPLLLCSSGFSCGLRAHPTPAVAALLTCPSALCAPYACTQSAVSSAV